MVFKMLNEGYFEILYQQELENSDIVGKIPFLWKFPKFRSQNFQKSVFFTRKALFLGYFWWNITKFTNFPPFSCNFAWFLMNFGLASRGQNPRGGVLRANPRGGIPTIPPPLGHQCSKRIHFCIWKLDLPVLDIVSQCCSFYFEFF